MESFSELAIKPSLAVPFLMQQIEARNPVLLKGPPGTAKTAIVEEAGKRVGARVITSHPVVSDPTEYKGQPWVVDGQATHLPFTELRQLIEADGPAVFFLDDLGQSTVTVQAACMQLILGRRINSHCVSDYITFIAATNRKQDRAGVTGILEPVKSRFVTIIEISVDVDDWVSWALRQPDIPMEVIAFIRFRPSLLFDFKPTSDIVNTPCPRTVHNIGKLFMTKPEPRVELSVYAGAAGEAFATEFVGFLRIFRHLPNPDRVIMDPANADIPGDPATMYALCGALSSKASEQNMEQLVIYANRIPPEFSVLLVKDSINRCAGCTGTRAFIDWADRHQDFLV